MTKDKCAGDKLRYNCPYPAMYKVGTAQVPYCAIHAGRFPSWVPRGKMMRKEKSFNER